MMHADEEEINFIHIIACEELLHISQGERSILLPLRGHLPFW